MKISACMIAKNEEENLPVCLRSLQGIVDEIIFVDTGSMDQTIAIAKAFGARVYTYPWQDDFAAAKNFALEQANGDWVIFLDADEYFVPETIQNVRTVIEKHANECDGYLVKLINIDVDDENKPFDSFFATRMFKNLPELRFWGRVHEELRFANGRKKALLQVAESEIVLYHTGYSQKRKQQKCQRNLQIILAEMEKNPQDINLYRYLADVYYGLEDYGNAIKYAKLNIETGVRELSYASRSYRILNQSLLELQAPKEEREIYLQKSIAAFSNLPDFYVDYALFQYNQQNDAVALTLLTKALELHEQYHDMETSLFEMKKPITYLMLGLLYERKDDFSQAIEYYQQALQLDKYYPEAFHALFQLIQQQDAVYVIAFLNTLYDMQHERDIAFLIEQIGAVHQAEVYLYYCHKMNLLKRA